MSNVEVIAKIVPSGGAFFVSDATDVNGGYMTVFTIADRDALVGRGLTIGALVAVLETKLIYRFDSTSWSIFMPIEGMHLSKDSKDGSIITYENGASTADGTKLSALGGTAGTGSISLGPNNVQGTDSASIGGRGNTVPVGLTNVITLGTNGLTTPTSFTAYMPALSLGDHSTRATGIASTIGFDQDSLTTSGAIIDYVTETISRSPSHVVNSNNYFFASTVGNVATIIRMTELLREQFCVTISYTVTDLVTSTTTTATSNILIDNLSTTATLKSTTYGEQTVPDGSAALPLTFSCTRTGDILLLKAHSTKQVNISGVYNTIKRNSMVAADFEGSFALDMNANVPVFLFDITDKNPAAATVNYLLTNNTNSTTTTASVFVSDTVSVVNSGKLDTGTPPAITFGTETVSGIRFLTATVTVAGYKLSGTYRRLTETGSTTGTISPGGGGGGGGSEVTKLYVDTQDATKQDKLTAGNNISITNNVISSTAVEGIKVIGVGAVSDNNNPEIVIAGKGVISRGNYVTIIGNDTRTDDATHVTVFGHAAEATASYAAAIGDEVKVAGTRSTIVGSQASTVDPDGVGMGFKVRVVTKANSIGANSSALATGACAFGYKAHAQAFNSVSIGHQSRAAHNNSMAFGANTTTTKTDQVHFGGRLLSGAATPVDPTDVATKAYVDQNGGGGGGGEAEFIDMAFSQMELNLAIVNMAKDLYVKKKV